MTRATLYLLDTNTCIHIMNHEPPQVRAKMVEVSNAGHTLGLSAVALHELLFGVRRSATSRQAENMKRLRRFAAALDIFDFDDPAAEEAAQLRSALTAAGTPIGPYDALIAGHALSLNAVLITNNVREFSRVPGLKYEDWTV